VRYVKWRIVSVYVSGDCIRAMHVQYKRPGWSHLLCEFDDERSDCVGFIIQISVSRTSYQMRGVFYINQGVGVL
jgi:hypothetical protein